MIIYFFMLLEFTIGQICPITTLYIIIISKKTMLLLKNFYVRDNFYFMKSFSL